MPRIVSFLPSGTEIVHALGAGRELVGRSHECDFPPSVTGLPIVSRPALDLEGADPAAVDRAISERMATGASMYAIDEQLLHDLHPDVIITQDLCRVCAPSGNELSRAVGGFDPVPEILFLTPHTIADIEANILAVGDAVGRSREAEQLVRDNRARMSRVTAMVDTAVRRRTVFLEWTDPLFCSGHWVPEMITLAGGHDPLGRPGADSVRIEWQDVVNVAPDVIIVSPCGFGLAQATELARALPLLPGSRLVPVDANAYFARPGPRIAEAVEMLARIIHPELDA